MLSSMLSCKVKLLGCLVWTLVPVASSRAIQQTALIGHGETGVNPPGVHPVFQHARGARVGRPQWNVVYFRM